VKVELHLETEFMAIKTSNLEKLLSTVYTRYQKLDDPAANKKSRRDFVFHMTDWVDDLRSLSELYQHPERFDKEQAGRIVVGFLYHVIPHLQEAGRLMLDYDPGDVFAESREAT
jgi:hypothetical protein